MEFVNRGHLGGYVKACPEFPHGDPLTYCPKVWDWAVRRYSPKRVLDVGCGEGHTVRYFRELGIEAFGIDGCREALDAGRAERSWLLEYDFTKGAPVLPFHQVDLVWCCEFVEHVEEKFSGNFLSIFDLAKRVCMTHAFPGQAGHHHVNCQPVEYWTKRMVDRGFVLDEDAVEESRALDQPDGHWARSGLVFVKGRSNGGS